MIRLRWAALGLLLGGCFGVVARLWMRFISTAPEFTVAGTGVIVVAAMVGGLGIGLVRGARLTGARPANRLWALLALPFLAAPMGLFIFLAAALLGGWALAQRGPKWARALAAAMAVVLALVPVIVLTPDERTLLAPLQYVWMVGGLLVLEAALALAGREVFRAWKAPAAL